MAITHAKVSTVPDSADPDDIHTSDWNADHVGTAADVGAEPSGAVATHAAASDPHGDRAAATSAIGTHEADTTSVHGFTDTANIARIAGELGGTGASPTVVASHSGSTHAAVQAAAEATAASAATTHAGAADPHTGYQLETAVQTKVDFSKQGVLAVTTGALRWYNKTGRTLTFANVTASVGTAPANQAILVDVNVDGTTIFSTQGNRPSIAAAGNTAETTTFNTTTIATGAHYITVDIDQVGTTTLGSDLTVTVWMTG